MDVVLAPQTKAAVKGRTRVMIVDDAVVVRGLFARWVEAEADMQVAAALRSGHDAIEQLERADPDVVVLDIEMPGIDGISALPQLLKKRPGLVVIMASTLTRRNAEISLKALALGAADYIPKPAGSGLNGAGVSLFRRDLIEKIRHLGIRARRKSGPSIAAFGAPGKGRLPSSKAPPLVPDLPRQKPPVLRAFAPTPPRVLLIGASTGGPQALTALVGQLAPVFDRAPVLITQHMPPTFTTILAEHLARASGRPAREATDGEEINAGTIYLAPGGRHMRIERRHGVAVTALDDGPMVNFCKPSVDPMFTTAAAVWGSWALGVMLTGMGADGLAGSRALAAAGGAVVAQDEATSVVWGMPGQVIKAGLASVVLPLDEIAPRLNRLFAGERA
jgi:two-component system chemotaxis response regulator CheB